jgi:antirestriction protein ArdC
MLYRAYTVFQEVVMSEDVKVTYTLTVKERAEELENKVKAVIEGGQLADFLKFSSRFYNYSFGNLMWIFAQRPEATHVASYGRWTELKRQVKKGSKGIKILAPLMGSVDEKDMHGNATGDKVKIIRGFKLVHVFDIADTEGEPLPGDMSSFIKQLEGEADVILWEAMVKVAACPVSLSPMPSNTGGCYIPSSDEILINNTLSRQHNLKTLIHEISHRVNKDEKSDSITECTAEGVAYVVAGHLGIDSSDYSVGYLASWSKGNLKLVASVGKTIIQTAQAIIKSLDDVLGSGATVEQMAAKKEYKPKKKPTPKKKAKAISNAA